MTQGHGPLFHKFHEIQEFMTPWHGHSAPPREGHLRQYKRAGGSLNKDPKKIQPLEIVEIRY